METRAFPAIHQDARGNAPEAIAGGEEAACYYHPRNRAVADCAECGRFLCALCELPMEGRRLCPNCVNTGLSRQALPSAETERRHYDSLALALATWPVLLFYFTIFTAPAALYYVVRYWSRPPGILPRTRLRFVIAGVLAVLQIAGWIALVAAVASGLATRGRVDL